MEKRQAVEFLEYLRQDRNLERTIYGDALNIAIEALKAQLSKEGATKGTTFDLISRTATIDAVNNAFDRETLLTGLVRSIAVRAIRDMPTIQPVVTDTNVGDTISRQAAIDALDCISGVEEVLRSLPPAQPETLTDKEQRIFLAAMGREEQVCRQVDDECGDCREPYEDSLVRTCHEITRKVKAALWT